LKSLEDGSSTGMFHTRTVAGIAALVMLDVFTNADSPILVTGLPLVVKVIWACTTAGRVISNNVSSFMILFQDSA
jgi:hypothetical protein